MPGQAALQAMTAAAGSAASSAATVDVSLPKVSLSTQGSMGDMKSVLDRLGMGQAFTSTANFTALSPKACCIGLIQQAATLQVGEKGTVGAAAAAVTVPGAAPVPVTAVVFNRPYLMLVTDTATGEPLFLAKVANPAQ